jgi:hypothetical protein
MAHYMQSCVYAVPRFLMLVLVVCRNCMHHACAAAAYSITCVCIIDDGIMLPTNTCVTIRVCWSYCRCCCCCYTGVAKLQPLHRLCLLVRMPYGHMYGLSACLRTSLPIIRLGPTCSSALQQ